MTKINAILRILFVTVACLSFYGCGAGLTSTPTSSINDNQQNALRPPGLTMQDVFRAEPGRNIDFKRLTVEHGLSVTAVNGIVQDQKGFMWIGTEDGLNKYDGYKFEIFRHDPEDPNSLSDSSITDLYVDRDGMLWIGTYRGGLNRFDPMTETFTRFEHLPLDSNSLSNNQVTAIHQDSGGYIWVGTTDGLNRYNPGESVWKHFRSGVDNPATLSSDVIGAIYEDSFGTLWVGTGLGLDRYIPDSGQFTHYQHIPDDTTSLSGDSVQSIYQDQSGALWIGTTDGGLNRYLYERNWFLHYTSDPTNPSSLASDNVKVIFQDAWGILWVGTDSGLQWMDQSSGAFRHYIHDPDNPFSLSHDDVLCITEDTAGGLWIGTAYGGINQFDRRSEQFSLLQGDPRDPSSMGTNSVWTISEDAFGSLWLGTNGMGLNNYDRINDDWTLYRHSGRDPNSLSNDVVMSVYEDDDGAVWIGTWGGGLNRLDVETGNFTHYRSDPEDPDTISSDIVFLVFEDGDGDLWLGTQNGLNQFDRESERFTRFLNNPLDPESISNNVIGGALYQDRSGYLWVGTHGGLNRFDKDTGTFARFLHNPDYLPSLGHDVVFAIHEDTSGRLWVGTFGGGLDKFDPDSGTFKHYRIADGLPNEVVYGILEDENGNLWLSTNDGLSRFDPETEVFRNFDVSDGVQAKEFNYNAYFMNSRGEMFFGGINGVNIFNPDDIVDNPHVPPIVLESISQGGDPIPSDNAYEYITETSIEWPNNYFEFEFTALDYFQPEQNIYAYKLEGFDDDWNYAGSNRYARYTNVPGGTYTLRIFGANNDGVWNTEGVSLTVTVVPPFWQTWWFIGLFVFAAVLVVVSLYRLRVGNLEARSRELAHEVEERTRALEERTKELEGQRGELAALYRADEQLHRHLEIDEVLQALVDTAVEILHCDKGAMLIWDDQEEVLRVAAAHGISEETVASVTFLPGEGIAGRVGESGELIAIEDVNSDERVTREIVDPEGIRAFMQVPIKIEDEVFGVFSADYLKPHTFSDKEKRLLTSLAQRAALAIENAKLYEDTKDRLAQVAALTDTAQAIASTLDLDRLLNIIIQQATTLLKADGGMINLVDWEKMTDTVVATTGAVAATTGMGGSLETSLSGWASRNNQPVISNDVQNDSRVDQTALSYVREQRITSAAIAPLTIKEQVSGTLIVIGTETGKVKFEESELDILVSFANQAAIAIENARLYEQAKQLAVVEERQRLARELHDSVTQALYGMTLYAEAMSRQLASGEMELSRQLASGEMELANEQLSELQTTAQEALREMRLLIFQLRPPNLEADGLVTVLRTRLEAVEARAGLKMEFKVDNDVRLPLEIEEGLYRIAQEALNNALKHASAQSVSVCLTLDEPIIVLEIIDDGIGFDPDEGLEDAGLGMDGMYERAVEIGGQFIVESKPGSGSKIRVEVER
jgi:signal transduction histidine kinase/ligand-binding sensor domain-containing protein